MAEQNTLVQIKILDREYQVNCAPADQEALMQSARHLDGNMRKIKERGTIQELEMIAVMAALNITHDMLRKERQSSETEEKVALRVKGIEDKINMALSMARQLEF